MQQTGTAFRVWKVQYMLEDYLMPPAVNEP